jgi:glycosyltransferase involved in cell wall biosynthesis
MNENFNPLVSIVIPVYNGNNYLCEALDSAVAQTYKNLEIIVINDGSIDDTEEIALSYGDKIRYFSKPNGGTVTALNLGIEKMRGDYFSWLSHDDLYYPQKIARSVEVLSKLEDKNTIIISDWDCIDENYKKIYTTTNKEHMYAYPSREYSYLYPIIYNNTHGCTHLISKAVFDTVGLFDEKWLTTHDYEFYYRAFAKFPHKLIPEVLVTVRAHQNRQGRRSYLRENIECSLLYINILENLSENEILEIAPSKEEFLLDMEKLFFDYNHSIALEYLEVLAESEKITTKYSKRKIVYDSDITHQSLFLRGIMALERYGIIGFCRILWRLIIAKLTKKAS